MTTHLLSIAFAVSTLGTSALAAASNDQHTGHHPAGSITATTSKEVHEKKGPTMAKMDVQTQAMRDMHEKVMATKTFEERNALMAEHMKTMQGDVATHHQMMEKRMEMMGASMQMMMDRLPAAPAK